MYQKKKKIQKEIQRILRFRLGLSNVCLLFQLLCNLHIFLHRARLLIVMEMMEGGELFHRISQHRHFTEKMASQVTKQVCVCMYLFVYVCACVTSV